MIANQVAARGNFPDQIGASARKFSDQKKCRVYGVTLKQIEKLRSDSRVRAIIERERDRLGGGGVPHCGSEQLGRRPNGSPSCDTCGGHHASWQNDRPRVQFVSNAVDFRTASPGIPADVLVGSGAHSDNRLSGGIQRRRRKIQITSLEESRRTTSAHAAGPLPSAVFGSTPCMDDQRNSNCKCQPLDEECIRD